MSLEQNLKKIDFERLNNFYQVFREGSFSKAAKKSGKKRHIFYHDLSLLEKSLEVKLYFSGKKTFILTEEGNKLAEFCKESLDFLTLISNQKPEYTQGDLTIHTTIGLGLYFFTKVITEFQEIFPKINIKLRSGLEYLGSKYHDFDVIAGPFLDNRQDLIQYCIKEVEYGYFASKQYIKKNGCPQTEKDFKNHVFLCYEGEHFIPAPVIKNAKTIIESNSYSNLQELCTLGAGISSLPLDIWSLLLKENSQKYSSLVRLLPGVVSEKDAIYFSFRKSTPKEKTIRELMNLLKKNILKF